MHADPAPDMALAARLFAAIHDATRDPAGGVTREAYGPGERAAHALVRAEAVALGLEPATDAAGNLYLTLPGARRAAQRIVLGSHLDSVPQGGDYDGAAGVVAGLAVLSGLRRAGVTPDRDVTVMAIRAEEAGAWFPFGCPGSKAALGTLPPAALDTPRQDTGRSLAAHMAEEGFDPQAVRQGQRYLSPDNVAAFVELHIEQGPVLDTEEIAVGIVTGIPGSRRHRFARVVGRWGHSGATPRRYRSDAAIAAAELAVRLDDAWARMEAAGHELVCTVCVLATTPQAGFTKIAGEAEFKLDVRSLRQDSLDMLFATLHRLVPEIEGRRGVRIHLGPESAGRPTPMHPAVIAELKAAARSVGVAYRVMPSGGGHDAAAFAQAGVPAGMLFVRNQNGSHTPDEAMRLEDFDAGGRVLMRWLIRSTT
jgi:N-carbamoyl-L-amino-acid hydrolase